MSAINRTTSFLPILLGSLALGCTFEPPGSVLDNGEPMPMSEGPGNPPPGGNPPEPVVGGETVTITFSTIDPGGAFSPKNNVAVWIEAPDGTFVQTIARYSNIFTQYLRAWNAVAPVPPVDVASGATRQDHNSPVTATWNIPADMPNGSYTIRLESGDANVVTAEENSQAILTFNKDGIANTLTPIADGFADITIDYSGTIP